MDQESFRRLLEKGGGSSNGGSSSKATTSRGSFTTKNLKPATLSASEPAFKPRKVKKTDAKYRDRAAERRVGDDYAEVESVIEDLKQRNDDDPSRPKGLDLTLLEQVKAGSTTATANDDDLEKVFLESNAPTTRKRTRQELIEELKEARNAAPVESTTTTTTSSKFKPIGFKPIGSTSTSHNEEGKKRKKKKRKVQDTVTEVAPPPPPPAPAAVVKPEPEAPEDFDIFADAGDYEGLPSSDDEAGEEGQLVEPIPTAVTAGGRGWFNDNSEPDPQPRSTLPLPPPPRAHHDSDHSDDDSAADPSTMRLVPLSTSVIPSIKDILAMDQDQAGGKGKRKRKPKAAAKTKDGEAGEESKPQLSAEAKAERDYKRLQSYQDKKAGK